MRRFELIAPCHFGMESVLKREITDLGYDITDVADGRVTFFGDEEALCRANIFLRTAERILIKIGSFHAETFEELFQGTKSLPWEDYIPKDGKFWVAKAASVKSKLFSPSDIQSIMKKAMVDRLKSQYEISWFPEDGASFPVRVFLMKDEVTVGLDSIPEADGKSAHCGEPGSIADHADSLERRKDPGGSFLRKRYVSDRSSHDGGQYGPRQEPELYGRRMATYCRKENMV